ncbi:DUF3732 domain-containing protein [Tenacibaculum sp. 1B UA]|uniref:DUF3732 domain-containing protein n=1 Tax=Tenacibaculum sp. 1B UA TaxID=2922252 RepID=UPI002A24E8EC|nr:DUF3732 domain-containing protein [Tenacibaculum sp. 1B UA]MDX8554973.1 DUF3732 domain-containing protein [Tenacibaculum sp. 1B UA]
MNCYIKEILLFGEGNEKRIVPLKQGLNVITGASQTGKSALIEIVDYCFCSKFSSIPRGKINDWTDLYSIVLEKQGEYMVIGRRRFSSGGDVNMYCSVTSDYSKIRNIEISYFNNSSPQKLTSVKKQIGQFFGITVKNTNETLNTKKEGHTASIRNLTSFMFQYQNLIASKHALFSRFDDPIRKKDTISQLPVFLGWVDDKYYSYVRERELLLVKQNRLLKLIEREEKQIEKQTKELNAHFKNYYSIIGKRFTEAYSVEELLILRNQLPDYNEKTFVSETLSSRYIERKEYRDRIKSKRDLIQKRIANIELYDSYTANYQVSLLELSDKADKGKNIRNNTKNNCPVCGQDSSEVIIEELKKLNEARQDLQEELKKTKDFKEDYSSELQKLNIEKDRYDTELRKVNSQVKYLERQFKDIEGFKSTGERAIYAKAKLDLIIDNIANSSLLTSYKEELNEVKKGLKDLTVSLGVFDIESKLNNAQKMLNDSIGDVCSNLDFEKRFLPVNPQFDIRDFTFSIFDNKNKTRIRLSELGSGSNWLATHIGVFLSFLKLSSVEGKSKIPSVLFFDQPSQIYFPNEPEKKDEKKKNKEFEKVENIYNVILDKLKEIKEESGYSPQVIITDHADNLNLKKGYHYESFVVKRWWGDSNEKALI